MYEYLAHSERYEVDRHADIKRGMFADDRHTDIHSDRRRDRNKHVERNTQRHRTAFLKFDVGTQ